MIQKDLDMFIFIQVEKYFQRTGKKDFTGEPEIRSVIELIIENYNNRIAPDKLRLDNLSDTAKKNWFSSIEIDWSAKAQNTKKSDQGEDSFYQDMSKIFDEAFDFLPAGSMNIMMYSGAAFDAVNFPLERYESFLLKTLKPDDEEREIIMWAYEVTLNLMAAESEQFSLQQKKEFYLNAVDGLQAYLEEKEAIKIAKKITRSIKDAMKPEPAKGKKKK